MKSPIVVGVDASRNRSGGACAHLIGILCEAHPPDHGIERVHVWAYESLLSQLPERPWLQKHNPPQLEQSILSQALWQVTMLPGEFEARGCDILLNTDAGTLSSLRPSVTMSRDMLSFEPGEIERYGWTQARLRLLLLRYIQCRSLTNSDGAIFLTRHAAELIQECCGRVKRIALIPHGVGTQFREVERDQAWPEKGDRPIRCLYVSKIAPYKHQWHVVRAVGMLRSEGIDAELILVGGGEGPAQRRLQRQIVSSRAESFVHQEGFVSPGSLPERLAGADIFVFASSCENMPNTLLEAMATGIPIACSDRGPMPEVLGGGGVYFDPEDPSTIARAVRSLVEDPSLRHRSSAVAKHRSADYSWSRCARETCQFLSETVQEMAREGAVSRRA